MVPSLSFVLLSVEYELKYITYAFQRENCKILLVYMYKSVPCIKNSTGGELFG